MPNPQLAPRINVRTPDNIRHALKRLHDTYDLGWREIALLPQFSPIPWGTLAEIYKTGKIPPTWRDHLLGIKPKDLYELSENSPEILRWMLENREEMDAEDSVGYYQ